MMRTEDSENSHIPPTTRIFYRDSDTFIVPDLPVMGATYLLGKQLKDFIDLSDTVSKGVYDHSSFQSAQCLSTSVVTAVYLLQQATVQVSLSTDTIVNFWQTYNVLAYTHNHERDDAMIVVSDQIVARWSSPLGFERCSCLAGWVSLGFSSGRTWHQ